jgi:ABC-2 type transport system permease protein
MVLAFSRFAGEREDGTLRQLLASGVPKARLAIGKFLGVGAALAIVLVPAALVGAVAIALAAGESGAPPAAGRMVALASVYVAYFAVMLAMALAASAVTRTSSHALALVIAFWVLNAVIAPRVAADVARHLYPTPTAFEFAEAVEHDTYDGLPVHEYNLRRAQDLRQRLLREHRVARVEELPVNFRGIDYLEREAHSNSVWDTHYGRLWALFERQVHSHQLAGFAAPLLAVRSASMGLAGADFFHHQHFARAAEAYRRRLVDMMNRDIAYSSSSSQLGYTAGEQLWNRIPPFEYHTPETGWAIARQAWSLTALGAWLVGAILALALAVRAMRVD